MDNEEFRKLIKILQGKCTLVPPHVRFSKGRITIVKQYVRCRE